MWFLSPSGWPTHADSADEERDLQERGYEPIDAADVQAAIDAYQAGTPSAPQDVVTVAELEDPNSPASVALRAASVAAVRDAETVAPTGAWDFTQEPTVAGVPIGTGGGGTALGDRGVIPGVLGSTVLATRPANQPTEYNYDYPANGAAAWTWANYRARFRVVTDGQDVRLFFPGWKGKFRGEQNNPNAFTIRAAIEYPSGTFIPVTFDGRRDITLDGIGGAWSDPLGIDVTDNDLIYVRTLVTVASGGLLWPNTGWMDSGRGEGYSGGTGTATDLTTSGTITATSNLPIYGPLVVAGHQTALTARKPVLGAVGTSFFLGLGESGLGNGWLNRIAAEVHPMINLGQSGETAKDFTVDHKRRMPVLAGVDKLLTDFGTNDFAYGEANSSLAEVQAYLVGIANLARKRGVKKVYLCTMAPRTTGGTWATGAGQVLPTWEATKRLPFNAWVRSTPAPFDGFFEVADVLETARDSGLWKANYTGDGIHPSATAVTALVSALSAQVGALFA